MDTKTTIEATLARLAAMPRRERSDEPAFDVAGIIDRAGLPRRHRETKSETGGLWGDALAKCKEKLMTGTLIIICGSRGRGKTQLAAALIKTLAHDGRSSRYITLHDLSLRLKATFDNRYENERDVIDDLRKPRLLVVDEVGKVPASDWLHGAFFNLIDKRYGDMRDTLLISNHDKRSVGDAIGDSIVRRANGTGGVLDASGWEAWE